MVANIYCSIRVLLIHTLPLNVSRDMLQQHNSLETIKKLIGKALDMICKLAEEDP